MNKKEISLWNQMADLTLKKCKETCKVMGSCCDRFYCDIAKEIAKKYNVVLNDTGNEIPFLDSNGKCIVPPQFRQMCTLHQCEINSIGIFKEDPNLTDEYFKIRDKLNEFGFDECAELTS